MLLRQTQLPGLDPLPWHALHHAALDNLKLKEYKSSQCVQVRSENNHAALMSYTPCCGILSAG